MPVLKFFTQNVSIFILGALLVFLTFGCVSTHYGHEYEFAQDQLKVSCTKDYSIIHSQIKGINCAFENTGSSWVEVKVSKFVPRPAEGGRELVVLSPARIESFLTAYKFEAAKQEHNTGLMLAGLVIGSAVASGSGNTGVSAAALGTAVTVAAYKGASDSFSEGNGLSLDYGNNHVLGPAFEIPPKAFLRRTVLIDIGNAPEKDAWPQIIELCLNDAGGSETVPECREMKFWTPEHARSRPS